MCKPDIKGRAFVGSGNDIIETQTYYTVPEKDWEFDLEQRLTYNNPEFIKQCKLRKVEIDNTGWVPQIKLDKCDSESNEYDNMIEEFEEEFDDDFDIEEDIKFKFGGKSETLSRTAKSEPSILETVEVTEKVESEIPIISEAMFKEPIIEESIRSRVSNALGEVSNTDDSNRVTLKFNTTQAPVNDSLPKSDKKVIKLNLK